MILVIPPLLMWKVKIGLRQTLGIGFFLSLGVCMIIIAIIRISQVHASDFDIWETFWQQFEVCCGTNGLSDGLPNPFRIQKPGFGPTKNQVELLIPKVPVVLQEVL
ncbi:hypothetical protein OEA41_010545 [Lepraria neglecta]|uniref:Uncharacterized protein n=1 Tax=Lepraria neglecta TaxID=209136 RepID=A0AAD9YZ84_9LECA|nr:hypothetical protein OEA41_010545 [Lepraria neglecta]